MLEDAFSASIDLGLLNGVDGFIFLDNSSYLYSANYVVSGAGDINADGFDDVVIGTCVSGSWVDEGYVIFGSKSNFPAQLNSINLNGQNGFIFNGINAGDGGCSVSGAGDVNGDGIADILIGAPSANSGTGQSYVIFGSKNAFPTSFNLSSLNGNNGFVIDGISNGDNSGSSVSGAGDVNNDGIADIIISAPNANRWSGQIYIVFGSKIGFPVSFNLNSLNGANGFTINSIYGSNIGYHWANPVSNIGDVNNDGIDDIIIGAPNVNKGSGQGYVVFGSRIGFASVMNLTSLNGANGFVMQGYSSARVGWSVSGAGDVNGDGIADIIIGAPINGGGTSYIVFGNSRFSPQINLNWLNGADGFKIYDDVIGTGIGSSVSGAGDVNRDGIDDVIIGSWGYSGQSYIVFGNNRTVNSMFALSSINGNNGFIAYADPSSVNGAGIGDFNGDGNTDFVVGSQSINYEGLQGKSYIVLDAASVPPPPSPTPFPSPSGSDHTFSTGAIVGTILGSLIGGYCLLACVVNAYARAHGWVPPAPYVPAPAANSEPFIPDPMVPIYIPGLGWRMIPASLLRGMLGQR